MGLQNVNAEQHSTLFPRRYEPVITRHYSGRGAGRQRPSTVAGAENRFKWTRASPVIQPTLPVPLYAFIALLSLASSFGRPPNPPGTSLVEAVTNFPYPAWLYQILMLVVESRPFLLVENSNISQLFPSNLILHTIRFSSPQPQEFCQLLLGLHMIHIPPIDSRGRSP